MATIADGVTFNHIAREWRFKWSPDNDKASLSAAQKVLVQHLPEIKSVPGLVDVQRVVCGGCLDFKVIVKLNSSNFDAWKEKSFAPEESFLTSVKSIPGLTAIETQTYTLETI
eukprot:gene24646-32095_t